jgi:hypothetical protein
MRRATSEHAAERTAKKRSDGMLLGIDRSMTSSNSRVMR